MKYLTYLLFVSLSVSMACKPERIINEINLVMTEPPTSVATTPKITIKIGASTFTATLLDNPTANAFKALLPLTINMKELDNNEKFFDLPKSLPTNSSVPASIQSGDLMMYGANTLVLFYKGFTAAYSYTKIGKIDDVTGLTAALGAGDVKVSFEINPTE